MLRGIGANFLHQRSGIRPREAFSSSLRRMFRARIRHAVRLCFGFFALAMLLVTWRAEADSAKRIYAGIYLRDVTSFDQKNGVFDADVELWAKWMGDFDKDKLVLTNAATVEQTFLEEEHDGDWHSARWRVRGTFRGQFPLQRFPFDNQTIAILLELPERHGELTADLAASGMAERFSITGWHYDQSFRPTHVSAKYASDLGAVTGEGEPTTVHRVGFEVVLKRPLLMVALKFFLPLGIIGLVALFALFLAPDLVDARTSIGVTALLACFAFQFTISDSMPSVAYMTVADSLFVVGYILCTIALSISVIGYGLTRKGREAMARRIDRIAQCILPTSVALSVFVVMPPAEHAAPRQIDPEPTVTREKTQKDVLRVGTSALPTIFSSLLSDGIFGSIARAKDHGEREPTLVETVPGVSSDALQFLPGGPMVVHWRLREEAKWSDGTPLSAADICFGVEMSSAKERKTECKVVGTQEAVITYDERTARSLEPPFFMPKHVFGPIYAEKGYEPTREVQRKTPSPSLGAFRVVEFVPEERLVVERNPHFRGPPANFSRIEVKKYADREALIKAFENDEIDLLVPNSITPDQAAELAKRRSDAVMIKPSNLLVFLQPDLSLPAFRNRETRRALLQSIDRVRISREVYGEAGRIAHAPLSKGLPKGVVETNYDPEAAKKVLESVANSISGLVLSHNKSPVDTKVAQIIQENLAAVGINVSLKPLDTIYPLYKKASHGGLVLYAVRAMRGGAPQMYWSLPVDDGQYRDELRNVAYDDTIATIASREKRALYPERREALQNALLVAFSDRLPMLPIVFAAERLVVRPNLRGWEHDTVQDFGQGIDGWYFVDPAK